MKLYASFAKLLFQSVVGIFLALYFSVSSFAEPEVRQLYHESGALAAEGLFVEGLRHGYFREYNEQGQLIHEGNYQQGKKDGVFKEYNEQGVLVWQREYSQGKLHGFTRKWYADGSLASEWQFEHGQPIGLAKEFYSDAGAMRRQWDFSSAKCSGEVVTAEFDPDGQVRFEKRYTDHSLMAAEKQVACTADYVTPVR